MLQLYIILVRPERNVRASIMPVRYSRKPPPATLRHSKSKFIYIFVWMYVCMYARIPRNWEALKLVVWSFQKIYLGITFNPYLNLIKLFDCISMVCAYEVAALASIHLFWANNKYDIIRFRSNLRQRNSDRSHRSNKSQKRPNVPQCSTNRCWRHRALQRRQQTNKQRSYCK